MLRLRCYCITGRCEQSGPCQLTSQHAICSFFSCGPARLLRFAARSSLLQQAALLVYVASSDNTLQAAAAAAAGGGDKQRRPTPIYVVSWNFDACQIGAIHAGAMARKFRRHIRMTACFCSQKYSPLYRSFRHLPRSPHNKSRTDATSCHTVPTSCRRHHGVRESSRQLRWNWSTSQKIAQCQSK